MSEGLRKRNVISQKPAQNDNKVKPQDEGDLTEELVAGGKFSDLLAIIGTILLVGFLIAAWLKVQDSLGL